VLIRLDGGCRFNSSPVAFPLFNLSGGFSPVISRLERNALETAGRNGGLASSELLAASGMLRQPALP
jgi:hypothetical protein